MKTLLSAAFGLLTIGVAPAADPDPLHFGSERIGVPPLSLLEGSRAIGPSTGRHRFGTDVPTYSAPHGREGPALNLIPRSGPNLESLKANRLARAPRISREFGMPIIEPSDAVDYKLTIVPPDPAIDFKMIVADPVLKDQPAPKK
jgi:hypothetical protein